MSGVAVKRALRPARRAVGAALRRVPCTSRPAWALALALVACGEQAPPATPEPGAGPEGAGTGAAPSSPAADGTPPTASPPASPPSSETAPAEVAFTCDDGAQAQPAELRRLTMVQYANTLRDLVAWALGDASEAAEVVAEAGVDTLPPDRPAGGAHGGYRRLDQALDQSHVDETFRVAVSLGALLTTPERLERVAGECAVDADADNDEACLSGLLRGFGARALRRPLGADDEEFYRAVYGTDPTARAAAYADVITVLLSAPELLYLVEHGEEEVAESPGSYTLSPHELASRLSYHFWQTLPDESLWQAAEDRTLLEPDVLAAQVERLMADPRARATMAELFGDFLELEELPALDARSGDPRFAAFAGDDLPGPELRQQVIDEALDMLAHYTWTAPGSFEELMASELSFARGAELSRLYGVEAWDGTAPQPALPAGEHTGLLTRTWFLASGSANTRPILRGVFLRRRLLCDDIAPPPGNVNAFPPEPRDDQTTREAVEELTQQPGTACAGCHATYINPLGFAFEGYDALGRPRDEQRLFDAEGNALGTLPVDTVSVPRVTPGDDRVASGPEDVTRWMLDSGKLEACLARHYFRFVFGREEDLTRDGCALERLRTRLVESGRIRDMLAEAGLLSELRQRRFEP